MSMMAPRKPLVQSDAYVSVTPQAGQAKLANMKMVCASTPPPKYHEGRFGGAGAEVKTPSIRPLVRCI